MSLGLLPPILSHTRRILTKVLRLDTDYTTSRAINLDNLIIFAENYLKHLHGRPVVYFEKYYLARLLGDLFMAGYRTLQELYEPVNKCSAIIKEWHDTEKDPHYIGTDLQVALAYTNISYRKSLPDGDVRNFVNGKLGTSDG